MKQATKNHEIDFVVVAFPTAMQFNESNHPAIPQQVFGELAAESGIEFIDLLPEFENTCQELGSDACEGYENALSADTWMHPTRLGHRIAAERILEFLGRE